MCNVRFRKLSSSFSYIPCAYNLKCINEGRAQEIVHLREGGGNKNYVLENSIFINIVLNIKKITYQNLVTQI